MSLKLLRVDCLSGVLATMATLCLAATAAQAQNSTLDMPLQTAPPPSPLGATQSTPTRNSNALPSRSAPSLGAAMRQVPASAPQVLAQLGTVTPQTVTIHVLQDSRSRALSVVARGANLAVVADGGDWWGVLMVNNTMGWVPKSALQLMDYQTTIAVPSVPSVMTSDGVPSTGSTAGGTRGDTAPGAGIPSNLDPRTARIFECAFSYLGVPYVWAGTSRGGLDCSGFLCNVYAEALGVHLPRHSGDQARVGQVVAGNDLRPGDRLYFDIGNRGEISHCGIYLGNGYFIHASTNHGQVAVDSLLSGRYLKSLICARRS